MTKAQRKTILLSCIIPLAFGVTQTANAMHIMEGYLPLNYCIIWGAICVPFLVAGVISIKNTVNQSRKTLLLFAMAGAYAFVLSALKIPSVTGSSSHPTGTGLGAVLFGLAPMAVLGIIVLLFQAILLAHGGLTTLGANTFSMAIAGPFVSYGIYRLCKALRVNNLLSVFLAASIGDLFTYCITSIQLGLAYPSEVGGVWASVIKFMGVFAVTQVPLAVIEGILTVVVIMGLEAYAKPEMTQLGYIREEKTV